MNGLGQFAPMKDDSWRIRLEEAIRKDGRTMREISLGAGLSHGYVHGILRDGKEPTLDRFLRICKEVRISAAYALLGVNVTPETEQIISLLESDPKKVESLLGLLGR